MKPARLYLAILVVFAFAVVAGWRIVGQMQAERYAQADPERALGWRPDHPQALLVLAERQLAEGRFAESRARMILSTMPMKASTMRGSNWQPRRSRIISSTCSSGRALR